MRDMNPMEQIQYVTDTASMITKFQRLFAKVPVWFSHDLIFDICVICVNFSHFFNKNITSVFLACKSTQTNLERRITV